MNQGRFLAKHGTGGLAPQDALEGKRHLPRATVPVAVVVAVLILAVAGAVLLRSNASVPLPVYWDAPEFALVDQDGDTLHSEALRGTLWVGSFVFTNCEDVCPLVGAQMARLRDRLADEGELGSQVRLLSFSVDPSRDTPEVLREYAEAFGGSPANEWAFLTGVPVAETQRLIQDGFRLTLVHPGDEPRHGEGNYQVMHSPRLILVDQLGRVRGTYDATEDEAVDRLAADLRIILSGT